MPKKKSSSSQQPKYPGIRITCNGNTLVAKYVETRITEGGVFYPITPSTEGGELYQQSFAMGELDVWGNQKIAIETEGEHAAQGGATALAVTGRRVVNFTSGQGLAYAMEQYYHAPGKSSTMVLEVGARALTKHALNVHCGHDDIYSALDTGWTILFAKDAQQAADQAVILRKVNELALNPGMNVQDGMLTTHSERAWLMPESDFLREFLGAANDTIDCPTEAQKELFGPTRRRVPAMMDLKNPLLLGPVQNQEHHMNGVVARRDNFNEPILGFLENTFKEFGDLTGRHYGLIDQYQCDDADTVFISLGCAAENIEEACDYLREQRNAKVGSIHINVIRPFPEAAVVEALRGKKNVIIIERTDEGMAGDNPLGRDIRVALTKAAEANRGDNSTVGAITPEEMPRLFNGSYGIGSRDFRPEHTLGAYEFATGTTARKDGKTAADGVNYFTLGIDHPYSVISKDTPSLLPEGAIAARFHSIGGWGMITTGKNLGEIVGEFGQLLKEKNGKESLFVNANPKYGSEKKGAPTNYFLVAAPRPVRVNCELNHVDIVLCCDPKAFTHTNPLAGLKKGGALIWESNEDPEMAWKRIPKKYRDFVKENNIRVYTLPGFQIAKEATDRPDLQLRMQGNSFLGAFFAVSPFFQVFGIDESQFDEVVRDQYVRKFGRFGDAVVDSNMKVMKDGYSKVREIKYGELEDEDRSDMRIHPVMPQGQHDILPTAGVPVGENLTAIDRPAEQKAKAPVQSLKKFDSEFRCGQGYHQPAGALASVGVMAAGTGATASKYVARRETPKYIPENCTQCMECITACPDTALPNTAQDVATVLITAVRNYVQDSEQQKLLLKQMPGVESRARDKMNAEIDSKGTTPFKEIIKQEIAGLNGGISEDAKAQFSGILDLVPVAYNKVPAIFKSIEKKKPGEGGVFSIFVSDLCKGCGECVEQCGDHGALVMVPDTEELNYELTSAQIFSRLLPDTPQKYLGLYQDDAPQDSRPAALRNHLMVRRNYEALVSGDGACAGCGEKSILRAIASVTEAYMRPMYHKKAERLLCFAETLEADGAKQLAELKKRSKEEYTLFKQGVAHILMGLGGETDADTKSRIKGNGEISDDDIISAIASVLRVDAFNHKSLQSTDGRLGNGMSTMFMGASTGCNTVYGSTPPSNPHPYPWMNSLFQDGPTISWLLGESLMLQHANRSVAPERLAKFLLGESSNEIPAHFDEQAYWDLTHLNEVGMTEQEIKELPKVWLVGGDGALGDIGFQNLSKVILQNRPNVKGIMLDTQVYSNTGGQNSDSSNMMGGYDMNQFGRASQGKLNEKKNVAEILTTGHGSPYVAQVSMANSAKLYQTILEGLEYRGTAFFQSYTTCQPEHGVADDMSAHQAKLARDSRGMPEFVYDPKGGETTTECFQLKGNPNLDRDWWQAVYASDKSKYNYTVAHWATTEARFRKHLKVISEAEAAESIHLDDILPLITQDDVVHRRIFDETHRSYIPDFGVYIKAEIGGKEKLVQISRQTVLFCVERRKAWRMLQSRAGQVNKDYLAQKSLLKKIDSGELSLEDYRANAGELYAAELEAV
ncbi:MAG: 2-oxoacid:acceptor oxidoreductase family protein [Verrucomicrobiales bacterium]|nr:2-oxoacid:acceptor oxidoreductase family protein [Verrucomicrobiales bacterium]